MVIVKQRGKLRICLYPTDLNKVLLRRRYLLKTLEEIVAQVRGSTVFTLLYFKKGFWQLEVPEKIKNYLALGPPWGRYTILRVPFGIATAPALFQRMIAQVLEGLINVSNSMDDILIFARIQKE